MSKNEILKRYFNVKTSSKEDISGQLVAHIQDLTVSFGVNFYRQRSIRESFVKLVSDPVHFISSSQQSHVVLDTINLLIQKGERIGIVGRNGAGKTTLCRCLAGMIYPTSGQCRVFGNVRGVFNATLGVIPTLSGRENAWLLARLIYQDIPDDELKVIVQEALAFSGLSDFLDTEFQHYSKGMQIRLCLSLMSAIPSELLILDEIFDGADEEFRQKIKERMLELVAKSGAFIFVSHSFDHIKALCDRVIVLEKSKIIFDGPTAKGESVYYSLFNS